MFDAVQFGAASVATHEGGGQHMIGLSGYEQRPAHTTLIHGRPGTSDLQAFGAATGRTTTQITSTDATSSATIARHPRPRTRDHVREAFRVTFRRT